MASSPLRLLGACRRPEQEPAEHYHPDGLWVARQALRYADSHTDGRREKEAEQPHGSAEQREAPHPPLPTPDGSSEQEQAEVRTGDAQEGAEDM
ncbi:MAG TPA: hypothetical protein VFV38_15080 [Ktedonobacteraceae bacterium]|nr:hypothetical protein [Ktedonobacteraceae bacterium]